MGLTLESEEKHLDAVVGLSGSAPAYVSLSIPPLLVRLIRTISLHFIVESQTWYQNDRGVMLISNQSDAKIIGLGSRVIIGLNWP